MLAEEPLCALCHTEPATEADHIVEREHGGDDRRENLQGVCRLCHAGKTGAASKGGAGRRGVGYPPSRTW